MFAIISAVLICIGNVFSAETNLDAFYLYNSGDIQKAFKIYSKILLQETTSFKERILAQCGKCCCMHRLGYEFEEVLHEMQCMHEAIDESYVQRSILMNNLYNNSPYGELLTWEDFDKIFER